MAGKLVAKPQFIDEGQLQPAEGLEIALKLLHFREFAEFLEQGIADNSRHGAQISERSVTS